MWESIPSALQAQFSNQIFSGGLALGILGLIITQFNRLLPPLWMSLKRMLVVTAVIDNRNDVFQAVIKWLNTQPYSRTSSFFTVTQENASTSSAGRMPQLLYSPAVGWHLLRYRGRLMWIDRSMDVDKMQPLETLRISMLFSGRAHFETLINEMMQASFGQLVGKTQLFIPDPWADEWRLHTSKPKRKMETVVLPEGVSEKLVSDVQHFLGNEARYRALGVPWRRGYLLHGPPGTGKTSLVFALAGELDLNICTLSLLNRKLNDQNIAHLLQNSPPRSILLLEDVDSFFHERTKQDSKIEVSFSGLLNALDGVAAQEGRVVFMTTNHVSTLDPALIRPGRIDVTFPLGKSKRAELRRMVQRFFPEVQMPALNAATAGYSEESLSPADVQQLLQECHSAEAALECLSSRVP
jgi:mitochondrial chaperone BCS1